MIPRRIEDANDRLTAPKGWRIETHGPYCGGLTVRVGKTMAGVTTMTSSWEPTPADVAALLSGGSVQLTVLGDIHPAVAMNVAP